MIKIAPTTNKRLSQSQTPSPKSSNDATKIQARGGADGFRLEEYEQAWCADGSSLPYLQLAVASGGDTLSWNFGLGAKKSSDRSLENCTESALLRGMMMPAGYAIASKVSNKTVDMQKNESKSIFYSYVCFSGSTPPHVSPLKFDIDLKVQEVVNLNPNAQPPGRTAMNNISLTVGGSTSSDCFRLTRRNVNAYKLNNGISDGSFLGFYQPDAAFAAQKQKDNKTPSVSTIVSVTTVFAAPSIVEIAPLRLSGGSPISRLMVIEPAINDALLFGTFALIGMEALALMVKRLVKDRASVSERPPVNVD